MLVVSSADFFSNPTLYKEKAENYGIKILPLKKEKRLSRRIQKKIDALNAVIGILPSDIDEKSIKAERLTRQWDFYLIQISQLIFWQIDSLLVMIQLPVIKRHWLIEIKSLSLRCPLLILCILQEVNSRIEQINYKRFQISYTLKITKITSKDLKFAFTGVMKDFEDALQAYCAKRYHIDYILTRNVKDFQFSPVKAIEPVDFINLL